YDLEQTKYIFISGDGVPWIKAGAEYIHGAHYVLDGFHLRRAIFRAAGADEEKREALFGAVLSGKKREMNRLLAAFRQETEKESRKQAISAVQTYINTQWSGIRAMAEIRQTACRLQCGRPRESCFVRTLEQPTHGMVVLGGQPDGPLESPSREWSQFIPGLHRAKRPEEEGVYFRACSYGGCASDFQSRWFKLRDSR